MSPPEKKVIEKDETSTIDGLPGERVVLSHTHPPNIPGKSLITLLVTLPPNATTPPHTHAGAAISATMLHGSSLNQMNCDEPKIYKEGETWYEAPGCHHVRSENVSAEEEARFVAVFVVDDEVVEKHGYGGLVVLDADNEKAN